VGSTVGPEEGEEDGTCESVGATLGIDVGMVDG